MGSNGYIAASGAMARLQELDVVANNLANATTPGFKRGTALFRSMLQSSIVDAEGSSQQGSPARSFVMTDSVSTSFAAGPVERTGAALDVAIDGPGFLEVQTPNGSRYTRGGSLVVNVQGLLSTSDGLPVLGEGGTIDVAGSQPRITQSGEVVDSEGNSLGNLKLVEFDNRSALRPRGQNLFEATAGAGQRTSSESSFVPGSREGSNVDPVAELAALVMLQRAFETNMKAMQADDEATNRLIREFSQ